MTSRPKLFVRPVRSCSPTPCRPARFELRSPNRAGSFESFCSLELACQVLVRFSCKLPLRPGSRPVLFSRGRPLPASCYMLAGSAGFTSRHQSAHVRSVVAHSLPARFEIVHESRVCMTVLFQCKLWLLPGLFISQSPAHHRVYRDAR